MATGDQGTDKELTHLIHNNNKQGSINYTDVLKGICLVLIWISAVTVSDTCCQLLERVIPDFQLNTFRLVITVLLMTIVLVYRRTLPQIPVAQIPGVLAHSSANLVCALSNFTAVTLISLSSAHCILLASAVASALLVFPLFKEEKINIKKVIFALLCITGVILVIQPDFLFVNKHITKDGSQIETNNTVIYNFKQENVSFVALGYVLSIVAGIGVSAIVLVVKKFPFLGENMLHTSFWSFVFGIAVSSTLMVIFERPALPKTWPQLLFLLGHCCTYVIIWSTTIMAAMHISGNTISAIYSSSAVLMLVPQYTVLSSIHPGNRNWMEVVGAVLVVLGSCLGSLIELFSEQ